MKILIVIEQLPGDEQILKLGGLIARQTQSSVTLLHILPGEDEKTGGMELLHRARDLLPDLPVETRLCFGKIVTEVLAETRSRDYELLVLRACLGAKPNYPHLSGVAWAVIRHVPTSTLIVRGTEPEFRRLLICTGGIGISEQVVEAGAHLARATGAEAYILHVAGTIPSMYTGLEEIEETLSELLSTDTPIAQHLRRSAAILARHNVRAHLKLRHGVVADEILRETSLVEYDMVITGAPETAHPWKKWLLGDVVEEVIRYTTCSFMIVKKPLVALDPNDEA